MPDAREEFIRATYVLSKRDPQAWIEFKDAFSAYAMEELERGVSVPAEPTVLAITNGMNKRMLALHNDFTNIEAIAAKIKVK